MREEEEKLSERNTYEKNCFSFAGFLRLRLHCNHLNWQQLICVCVWFAVCCHHIIIIIDLGNWMPLGIYINSTTYVVAIAFNFAFLCATMRHVRATQSGEKRRETVTHHRRRRSAQRKLIWLFESYLSCFRNEICTLNEIVLMRGCIMAPCTMSECVRRRSNRVFSGDLLFDRATVHTVVRRSFTIA